MKTIFHTFKSIRSRMWTALALLASATMLVGFIAWFTLDRANSDLNNLHRQTLTEVAQALSLSTKSADLSTTAPYLLNFSSAYRINKEGRKLIDLLNNVQNDWSKRVGRGVNENEFSGKISNSLTNMRVEISSLIKSSEQLDSSLQLVHGSNIEMAELRNSLSINMRSPNTQNADRLKWFALQTMANHSLGAGFAGNLLGVGEHHRSFVEQQKVVDSVELTLEQQEYYHQLLSISVGSGGIFELRRQELAFNLKAQKALFHIRYEAGLISDFTGEFAANAESFLSQKRNETSSSIAFAKTLIISIGLASILLALISALYFSSYVTSNISLVSRAMKKLAAGDRKSELTNKTQKQDEIGDLFRSFRVFRANALKLDRSNQELNRRNALFEKVFNNISDGVAITDENGRLSAFNPIFKTIFKIDNVPNPQGALSKILNESQFAEAVNEAKLNAEFRGFIEIQSDDGQVIEVRATRLPDEGRVWLFSDATERWQVGERLNQIRRIESLGKVTGEVAHDFGNILTTISSNLHLMESIEKTKKAQTIRDRISNAVEIGTSLTQRLLAFARKQHLEPEVTEINSLIEGLVDLISIGLKKEVTLRTNLLGEELFVRVDPGQLESAILNLCLNSNQAISGKGEITISVRSASKNAVIIEVADDGAGMNEKTKSQAMEPFFTNRQDGLGTGLGLSMVYGFIKQTGGDIDIDSKPKAGTIVRISLPTGNEVANFDAKKMPGNALLVEDDSTAMAFTSSILSKLGYSVYEAHTFQKGMEYISNSEPFELVVSDLQLNDGNSGWELVEKALKKSTTTTAVVVSGRMPNRHPIISKHPYHLKCLTKPFDAHEFEKVIVSKQPVKPELVA